MRRLLVALLLLALAAGARPANFWKVESERDSDSLTQVTFSAVEGPARGQGLLMAAQWARQEGQTEALEPSVVLAGLYKELEDFQLLGSKDALWGGQPARLISFKATVNKRPVVGRSLIAQAPSGTEALLLVTNQDMQSSFGKEFGRLQAHWEFGRPAAANVLTTHPQH
jgi:hypothetical protein